VTDKGISRKAARQYNMGCMVSVLFGVYNSADMVKGSIPLQPSKYIYEVIKMIYQLKAYYGALIGDKAIYLAELTFDDCTKLLTEPISDVTLKAHITKKIINDGFNPNDFTFDWITKEQYENKIESVIDEEIKFDSK
jgi:hypothetical protein